jgi:hypothetical protein
VVAEQAGGRIAERMQPFEHAQAVRAAVDEVAEHMQPIARRREADGGEQAVERIAAALQVADQKVHQRPSGRPRGAKRPLGGQRTQ